MEHITFFARSFSFFFFFPSFSPNVWKSLEPESKFLKLTEQCMRDKIYLSNKISAHQQRYKQKPIEPPEIMFWWVENQEELLERFKSRKSVFISKLKCIIFYMLMLTYRIYELKHHHILVLCYEWSWSRIVELYAVSWNFLKIIDTHIWGNDVSKRLKL